MNGPAADHDGNAAAAESAAPAAGVDTLFAQVYDRLKGMTSRQAAGVGATPEVVDTHISRKSWTPAEVMDTAARNLRGRRYST